MARRALCKSQVLSDARKTHTHARAQNRAFNLPHWTTVAHAMLWFWGMSALWIANVRGTRAEHTALHFRSSPAPTRGVLRTALAGARTRPLTLSTS
jgi:hypothetical protein